MSNFEQAEIYIKELMTVSIEMAIKKANKQLNDDRVISNLILMITGGQAVQSYFPNSPYLKTHDYDLKLIAPASTIVTKDVIDRMKFLAKGTARYINLKLNKYISKLNITEIIKTKYNVDLISNGDEIFSAPVTPTTSLLNVIVFSLKEGLITKTSSIIDIFVADPQELSKNFDYYQFTGVAGSNPILSEGNENKYYIPYKMINGLPYAGLGFVVWDTYRMVDYSREKGLPKYNRYVQKKDAILNALNNLTTKVSCNALKDYMLNCDNKYRSCMIDDKKFENVDMLIKYGVEKGIIPSDEKFIKELRKSYDIDYLCNYFKRLINVI